jgi:hypothetical protein
VSLPGSGPRPARPTSSCAIRAISTLLRPRAIR